VKKNDDLRSGKEFADELGEYYRDHVADFVEIDTNSTNFHDSAATEGVGEFHATFGFGE